MLKNALKTHCHRGHPLSGDNLASYGHNKRVCLACQRGNQRVKAGWPVDLAYSTPVQVFGQRPPGLAAKWQKPHVTPKPKRTAAERFLSFVEVTPGCWNWRGPTNETGYGRFFYKGRNWKAPRAAYELMVGPIPPSNYSVHGTMVLHTCDNPKCVNPLHLRLGTAADNMADAKAKGRLRGNKRNKLNEDSVRTIRARVEAGERHREIAADFGINITHVSHIALRKVWRSVQ